MKQKHEIKAGKPDIDTSSLGHIPGVKAGNAIGNYEKQKGHKPDGRRTAGRRACGPSASRSCQSRCRP